MGQYFKAVNVDRQEFVSLPGAMKAVERVTNPVAMGMIGYLLLDGPQDGTRLCYMADPDDPELQDGIDGYIEQEKEYERESKRDSVYRADDGSWNRGKVATVVAAGRKINEANEYAGRWAGDDVRLVGDYANNDLYDAAIEMWRVEYEGEEYTVRPGMGPIIAESIEREDIEHSISSEELTPGDFVEVQTTDAIEADESRVYAHYIETVETEWSNITDGLNEEFVEFVGEDWIESSCENSLLRPDMVLNA